MGLNLNGLFIISDRLNCNSNESKYCYSKFVDTEYGKCYSLTLSLIVCKFIIYKVEILTF